MSCGGHRRVLCEGVGVGSVVESVEASFKELVAEKPYRSITVKEICEGAYISRKTFYANFVDKRAIVAYIFRRDAVAPVERAIELLLVDEIQDTAPLMLERFYQGVLDERDFYEALVKPMASVDPTFELVVARALYRSIGKLVERCNPACDEDQLDFAAYYHACAQAITLERWICDGFKQTPAKLGAMQAALVLPALAPLLKPGM